ncbi:hypothetical protein BGW80DRAFT_1360342 [Lactifluus volemus]|nr:hypothetical protein BGW80DRAFT_1360342 [Lactifluus volemus]
MNEAISVSSVAPAMKTLYESIKSRLLAHLTIHNLPHGVIASAPPRHASSQHR